MRIKRFSASKVHGHMDFDVSFFDDLTFLTGINGSGKTTVVRGISALLPLSLGALARTEHERMKIEVEHEGKQVAIWSRKTNDELTVGSSEADKELTFGLYAPEEGTAYSSARSLEKELDYYREVEAAQSTDPVLKSVRNLPSPMALGIERRSRESSDPDRESSYRTRRRVPSTLTSPLAVGLSQAAYLAEERYKAIQADQDLLTIALRKAILMSALEYEEFQGARKYVFPERLRQDIEPKRRIVRDALQGIGLEAEEIERELEPFFSKLNKLSSLLRSRKDLDKVMAEHDETKAALVAEWFVNSTQFERIGRIFSYVEKYIAQSQRTNEPITKYLTIVNDFLKDGKKRLAFDPTGNLCVEQEGLPPIPVFSLSSGETQVVVIISHLMFNPALKTGNVFIVDEPELSLHVRWQELFVKAIREANPNLQLILATHSPSIILDDIEHCVDLGEAKR